MITNQTVHQQQSYLCMAIGTTLLNSKLSLMVKKQLDCNQVGHCNHRVHPDHHPKSQARVVSKWSLTLGQGILHIKLGRSRITFRRKRSGFKRGKDWSGCSYQGFMGRLAGLQILFPLFFFFFFFFLWGGGVSNIATRQPTNSSLK